MKAFISYPREQFQVAKVIYDILQQVGITTFLDKKSLTVGDEWEAKIFRELKHADFVILICSKETFSKSTMIARELELIYKRLPNNITNPLYLKPVKIGEVVLPDQISRIHYTMYKSKNFKNEILQSVLETAKYDKKTQVNSCN